MGIPIRRALPAYPFLQCAGSASQIGLIRVLRSDMPPDQTEVSHPAGMDVGRSPHHSGEGKVMSHGTRGGLVHTLFAGLGMVVCVSVIGCTDIDKPKDKVGTKQPGPGLPGLPRLQGQPGSGLGATGTGQPGALSGGNGLATPMGVTGSPVGRSPSSGSAVGGSTNFGTGTGNNQYIPPVGPNPNYPPVSAGSVSPSSGSFGPAAGAGAGYTNTQPLGDPG